MLLRRSFYRLPALFPIITLFLFSVGVYPTYATPSIIFVAVDGQGTGASWNTASNLQAALESAVPGDQLWIKAGTYRPSNDADRFASFVLKSGVALYGGFKGNETSISQRNLVANTTIFSGDLANNDTQSLAPDHSSRADNSYHVVSANGADRTTLLDGITITGGNASATEFPDQAGGGMLNQSSSLTLRNVTFRANSAQYGGGLVNVMSKSVLRNVLFERNLASVRGGGLINVDSDAALVDTTFTGNSAAYGGGISNQQSHLTVVNTVLRDNMAEVGGGMHNVDSSPTVMNCVVAGNQATTAGGGIASDKGARDTSPGSSPVITNCTVFGNTGGGIASWKSSLTVRNSILWNNAGGQVIDILESAITIQSSLVQGGYAGGTNIITADPLFMDVDGADNIAGTPDDDLRLQSSSPAVDAGNNDFLPLDFLDMDEDNNTQEQLPLDLLGNRRMTNVVDLGAYEAVVIEPELIQLYLPHVTR